jgi:putative permease
MNRNKLSDTHFRRDLMKLACLAAALAGTGALFFMTPALSTPALLSVMATMMLSPLVASLERRGYPRILSITILFATIGLATVLGGLWLLQHGQTEWSSFREKTPEYFAATLRRLREYENIFKHKFPFAQNIHPTDSLLAWGQETGKWFVTHGPSLMGDLLTCLFIGPLLTFVLLNEGPAIRRGFFNLVPNRFFETVFLVSNEIATSISDYIRAKLFEAFLVAIMTTAGMFLVGAPYAIVLGVLAGVTNIVPYVGPIVGAIPGIIIALLDPSHASFLWPMLLVYIIANVIDMVLIFPLIVAKLVNLHPLILIAVVAVGQQYYGLIGMLLSIPIATAFKVILSEIYTNIYEQGKDRA